MNFDSKDESEMCSLVQQSEPVIKSFHVVKPYHWLSINCVTIFFSVVTTSRPLLLCSLCPWSGLLTDEPGVKIRKDGLNASVPILSGLNKFCRLAPTTDWLSRV